MSGYTPGYTISMSNINTALNYGSTSQISLNDYNVRRLQLATSGIAAGYPGGGSISMASLRSKPGPDPAGTYESQQCSGYTLQYTYANGNWGSYTTDIQTNSTSCGYVAIVPDNGLTASSGSFIIQRYMGPTINVAVVAGGGGGGGGSGRTAYRGYYNGGGGGGSGGNALSFNVPVRPGQTLSWVIGGGGNAGAVRDGIYSSGSNGGYGGDSYIQLDGVTYAYATGGRPGAVAPSGAGGSGGYTVAGQQFITPGSGTQITDSSTGGGQGAYGYVFTVDYSRPLPNNNGRYAYALSYGAYGNGNICTEASRIWPLPGTGYGSGGSGGGCCQSDVFAGRTENMNASAGNGGVAFAWWGYTQ
jgi:hypothetical protein